jgi:L-seryl-tRNA(Ser) seleniumtransferase
MKSDFRHLPSVDLVLSREQIGQLEKTYPHVLVVDFIRRHLEHLRLSIAAGNPCPPLDEIVESICAQVYALENPSLRPVINATGVVLHTNLGRAPLSEEATTAMDRVAKGYCNLEFDLNSGTRGSRHLHIESILCQLTGAEAALVVNNNASAILLALTALAKRREVIVSRGQAVEIGGGFRIPDVIRQSGAKLIEVGTTNCTYITDYEQGINPRTAALMRVHSSNFRVEGFTHFVALAELVTLGNHYGLPVFDDLGSGCFLDTTGFGLDPEPMVHQSVATGAVLVFFSGDKLVGGPQAGIIVGQKQLIDKLKKHPLARAVRIDKVRLAGLAATLIHYLKDEALKKIPVWRMLSAPLEEIDRRARTWAQALDGLAQVIDGESMIGGGSLPGSTLPTRVVILGGGGKGKGRNMAQTLAQRLRSGESPMIGRISGDALLLDPRSTLPEEDQIVLPALRNLTATWRQAQGG